MTKKNNPFHYSLSHALLDSKPKKVFARRWLPRSAVVVLSDNDHVEQASILMIQRAKREGDPWSGHMAFPGGRYEKGDRNGLATAKREMHEEVGFNADAPEHNKLNSQVIGRLSDFSPPRRSTIARMVISPYVMKVEQRPQLCINEEVEAALWIPLEYFADPKNRAPMDYSYQGETMQMPCFRYAEEQVIWGITLRMIDELLLIQGYDIPFIQK